MLLTYATCNPLISWVRRNVANLTLCATRGKNRRRFGFRLTLPRPSGWRRRGRSFFLSTVGVVRKPRKAAKIKGCGFEHWTKGYILSNPFKLPLLSHGFCAKIPQCCRQVRIFQGVIAINTSNIRVVTAVTLFLVALFDMGYGVYSSRENLLAWYDLLILVLIVFTLFGSEMRIGLQGVSIKQQPISKQVEKYKEDLKKIKEISVPSNPLELESLIEESTNLNNNVWTKLIIYRMIMRALLLRLCTVTGHSEGLNDAPALMRMLTRLKTER